MTIYEFTVISVHGYPYYNKIITPIPAGVEVFLRFFDFSQKGSIPPQKEDVKFDLKAGLISALYNFSSQINQKIDIVRFRSRKDKDQKENGIEPNYQGNVLMSVTTEPFLFHNQVRKKIELIYEHFISSKVPLDEGNQLLFKEETEIVDILMDVKAKDHLSAHYDEIEETANRFLKEMKRYGLKAIVLTSLDLTPLLCFAPNNEFCLDDIVNILRNIGNIPDIDPLEWKYRQSLYNKQSMWVYLINSGIGIKVKELFESYYYLLITEPNSYLGEFPKKLTSEFNDILS